MKRIIVLGSLGMAGHVMVASLRDLHDYQVFGVARNPGLFVDEVLDVTDFSALEGYLVRMNPEYVVNCVGALVSHSNENISSAILLNSYLPHFLSQIGGELNYKLIHISTDCVFSGKKGSYLEEDFRDGDDNYARSKALGEVIDHKHLTIRTSIIGPELKQNGTGLFDFFLKQSGSIQGYTKAIWSGVTTLILAKAVIQAIRSDIAGLYHLTNGQPISKYELLLLFRKHTEKGLEISAVEGKPVNKSLVDSRKELFNVAPDYDFMVNNMVDFMRKNKSLYPHYSF